MHSETLSDIVLVVIGGCIEERIDGWKWVKGKRAMIHVQDDEQVLDVPFQG